VILIRWLPIAILQAIIVADPPSRYDFSYPGQLNEVKLDALAVHKYCGGRGDAVQRLLGCAVPLGAKCIIVLPKVESMLISKAQQDRVRRHEVAHCNGWGVNHD